MSVTLKSLTPQSPIFNIPSPPVPGGLRKEDFKITSATSQTLSGSASIEGYLLEVKLEGSFEYPNGQPRTGADMDGVVYTISKQEKYFNGNLVEQLIYNPAVDGHTQFDADTELAAAQTIYSGHDTFIGATGADKDKEGDVIDGYAGNDVFFGNGAVKYDDIFYGGSGVDTSVYRGKYANYTITAGTVWNDYSQKVELPGYIVTDKTSQDGRQQLHAVERLQFTDGTVALDFSRGENGYKAAMMIGAAFGEEKIKEYFAPAIQLFDQGMSSLAVAQLVVDLQLIENTIGSSSHKAFVNEIYENVVGVKPDALSEALYTNFLDTGAMTKAQLLNLAAGVDLLENQINLTGLQSQGVFYTAFL